MHSFLSASTVRAATRHAADKVFLMNSAANTTNRSFHATLLAQRQQRFTLGGPRRVRYQLANANTNQQKANIGGGRGAAGRQRQQQQQQGRHPTYLYVIGGGTLLGSVGLYFQYQNYAPMTNRRRWIASSPEFEKEMGDQNYQQLLQQFKGKTLPRHHPATIAIERVGGRIFQAAGEFAKEYDLEYFDTKNVTFTVVDTDQANAFVLPGNHVFFLSGMFKYARTEDEIGGILGHEMAHNLARHQGEKISSSALTGFLARLSLLFDPTGGYLLIFMPAVELFSSLPNSRTQETEADNIGMYLAAKACYDPEALGRVFKRMDQAGSDGSDESLSMKPPEFLSTHPADNTRIKNMQKWMPRDKKIFNEDEGHRCRSLRRHIQAGNRIYQMSSSNLGADGLPKSGWI